MSWIILKVVLKCGKQVDMAVRPFMLRRAWRSVSKPGYTCVVFDDGSDPKCVYTNNKFEDLLNQIEEYEEEASC